MSLLLVGVWWVRSPDPGGEWRALTDPATYADLADRAGELVDDVAAGRDGRDEGAGTLPDAGLVRTDGAPPPGLGEADSRLTAPVQVGDPNPTYGFATLQDDGVNPVAWSPCRTIHYVVRTEGAPAGFADVVRGVVAEVSGATGLVFTDDGATSEAPSASRESYLPDLYGDRWAPVLVAVSDPAAVPVLDGDVAGITYTYRARGAASGVWYFTSGAVYLDADALGFPAARDGEAGWVAVLRHEIGHLVGLDHVDDASQLMNPVTSTVRSFQDGDRTGLALLGQGSCAPDV